MSAGKRIDWADMAKGYGILAIMVSHVFTGHPVSQWLFTFHVPLFFFLSGFLFREGKPLKSFLKGKLRRMLIPYFALALPIIPAEAAMSVPRARFWSRVLELAGQVVIQRRLWPIWFLACLFLLELMGYVLIRFAKKEWLLALLAVIMGAIGVGYAQLGGPALPWNLDACFSVMPFFMAGYLLKKRETKLEGLLTGWKKGALFLLLALGNLGFGWQSICGEVPVLNVFANRYGIAPLSYLSAFCGIGAVILVAKQWKRKPICYLGENSLIYFVWHQTPVITAIYYFFPRLGIPMENYPSTLVMLGEKGLELLLILGVLTLCNECLLRSRLKWVLGR